MGRVVGWLVPYLGVLVALPFLTRVPGADHEYAVFVDTEMVVRNLLIPVAAALLVVLLATTSLGQWSSVVRDRTRPARWVGLVPVVLLAAVVAGTNYPGLADKDPAFTVTLLVAALCVGFGEEIMFRGLVVTALRDRGLNEVRVALWSSAVFGAAHALNIFVEGPGALIQVLITAVAGYFFYLIRRWSGNIVVPAVIHGLWDFGLFSASIEPDVRYGGAAIFLVADVVLAIVVLRRRRRVEVGAG